MVDRIGIQDEELQHLIKQYKNYRKKRAKCDENGKNWYDELDRFGGKMHQAMQRIVELIKNKELTSTDQLFSSIGNPDLIIDKNSDSFRHFSGCADVIGMEIDNDMMMLIYYWRGLHDFLIITAKDGIIMDTDWWFAFE